MSNMSQPRFASEVNPRLIISLALYVLAVLLCNHVPSRVMIETIKYFMNYGYYVYYIIYQPYYTLLC
jgi:hypothetical protein